MSIKNHSFILNKDCRSIFQKMGRNFLILLAQYFNNNRFIDAAII